MKFIQVMTPRHTCKINYYSLVLGGGGVHIQGGAHPAFSIGSKTKLFSHTQFVNFQHIYMIGKW